jgi:hypothetical protein
MESEITYSDGNLIYYDLVLTNSEPAPILAEINDQRQSSIINIPRDWEVSVVRFNISSELIPLFFPTIPNPAFPLRTNMSITLQYLGNYFRQYVQVTVDEVKNGVFDYTTYLDNINDASTLAFTALKAAFPAASGTAPPLFYLNEDTSLISMYVQDAYLKTNPNRIQIALNQPLQQILDFPCINRFGVPDPNGFEFEISVNNSANLLPVAPRSGYPFALSVIAGNLLQVSQEFRSLDEWSTVRSIVFSSDLPTVKEYVPTRVDQSQNNNVNNSVKPILTDFLLSKDSVEPTRHTLVYVPTAEYRMLSMQGTNSFSSIYLRAQYQEYNGRLRDVYIGSGDSMTVKLLFRRINKI